MPAPTAPTATTIVTEALKIYGLSSPASAQITRATDYGLEFAKWSIWELGTKWKPLQAVDYKVLSEGVSKYTNPADFHEHLSMTLLDGDHSGTLSAVTSTSNVTLAADEDAGVDDVEGKLLLITSGTGINQAVQVDGYNATTKVCALAEAFGTLPVTGDGYLIINDERELKQSPIFQRDAIQFFDKKEKPINYYPISNTTYGAVELYPVPDDAYGLQRRYYANLMMLDLAGALYTNILRRWQWVLIQGVLTWWLSQRDDSRYSGEFTKFTAMLNILRAKDLDNMEMSNLQITVSD